MMLLTLKTAILLAASSNTPSPGSLRQILNRTLDGNPQLAAIEAQIQALDHKVTQAGAWKEPKLAIGYQSVPADSFRLAEEPMSMLLIRVEQVIPFPGKTALRARVAHGAAQARRHELAERRVQLRGLVKKAYYRLALVRHLEKLTTEHIALVEQLIDAVRIKYEVGRAAQQDLLRLEVLRDRLTDELGDFDQRDRELSAALNAAMHRDTTTPILTPKRLDVSTPTHRLGDLRIAAEEHRPALKRLAIESSTQRLAAELASFEAMPDPMLSAAYGVRRELPSGAGGRDLVTIGIGMPLPLFFGSRQGAKAEEHAAWARSSVATREAMVDDIARGLEAALATWQRAATKAATYETRLVPEAHRALDATFAAFQVDRADFLTLFAAEMELLNFEKVIRTAAADALVARAEAEMLVGKELP